MSESPSLLASPCRPLLIGERELLAVEHPCYVLNAERAIHTLGGEREIARASASDRSSHLECHLRPADPLSHPLFGVCVERPALLLRVRRRLVQPGAASSSHAAQPTSAGTGINMEVVGLVRHSYQFEGLADFQYVASKELCAALDPAQMIHGMLPHQRPPSDGGPAGREWLESCLSSHTLRVPPALFCTVDVPVEFVPRSASSRATLTSNAATTGTLAHQNPFRQLHSLGLNKGPLLPVQLPPAPKLTRRSRSSAPQPMNFGKPVVFSCASVPQEPLDHVRATIDEGDALYKLLQARFSQRPVWSRQALRASLPTGIRIPQDKFRFVLPQLAYYFTNGPWRLCWIAYGYDPRRSSDSRVYQVLDLRLPSQLESLVPKKSEKSKVGVPVRIRTGDAGTEGVSTAQSSGPAGLEEGDPLNASDFATTHGRIPDDQALPTQRHVYFQLCDMKSEAMKRLIHDEGYGVLEGCSERTGWYSFKVISRMRQLLKDALFALAAPTSTSGGRDHRKRAWDDAACESIGHDHSKAAQKRGGGSQQLNKGSLQPNQESKASSSRTAAEQRPFVAASSTSANSRGADAHQFSDSAVDRCFGVMDVEEDAEQEVDEDDDLEIEEEVASRQQLSKQLIPGNLEMRLFSTHQTAASNGGIEMHTACKQIGTEPQAFDIFGDDAADDGDLDIVDAHEQSEESLSECEDEGEDEGEDEFEDAEEGETGSSSEDNVTNFQFR